MWTPAAQVNGLLNAFTVKAWNGTTASATPVQVRVAVSAMTPLVEGSGVVLGWTGYREGGEVTLRAVAEVDWVFDHWEGVGSGENERSNPVLYRMGGGARSKAVFVSSPGAGRFKGGSVVGDFNYPNRPILTDAVSVSAGNNHVMALLADGTVRAC